MLTTPVICAGFFILIGLGIMAAGAATYLKGRKMAEWATTQGRVLVSEIVASRGSERKFSGLVQYEFTVLGQSYRSQTVTPAELMGISDTGRGEAMQKVAKYPAGAVVTVYYDPQTPQRSVLERGGDSTTLILGGLFVVFGVVFILIQ
jgi:hypothetical protein